MATFINNSDFLLSNLLSRRLFNMKYFSVKRNLQKFDFAFLCISHNAPFDGWNFMRTCKIPNIFWQFSVIFVLLMYERPFVVTISLLKWCFCQAIIKLCFIIFVVWNIGAVNNLLGQTLFSIGQLSLSLQLQPELSIFGFNTYFLWDEMIATMLVMQL